MEFRELVSKEVDRLNGIIDHISDFANPPRLDFKPVNIKECLEQSLAATIPKSPANSVLVRTDLETELPLIQGDGTALVDAFNHVFRNALEAMAKQTEKIVTVTMRPTQTADAAPPWVSLFRTTDPGFRRT